MPGRVVMLGPLRVECLLDKADTAGAVSVFDVSFPAGAGSFGATVRAGEPPPLAHSHLRFDEVMHLLEGDVEVAIGDGTRHAAAGDVIYVPRGVPHGFANRGQSRARILFTAVPGELTLAYFEALAAAGDDEEARFAAMRRHGVEPRLSRG
jgi:mannose-6-phosphate isomerase-like protein (cupin superfamily)